MTDDDRISELLSDADSLPYGEVRTRLVSEAIRLADEVCDLDRQFEARIEMLDAGGFSGDAEQCMTALAWCVARYHNDPERYAEHQRHLLWGFKNFLGSAVLFPHISPEQAEKLRQQMASMCRLCGYNMRPVHYRRHSYAVTVGDRGVAAREFQAYTRISRDSLADCLACEANSLLSWFKFCDEPDKALDAAKPILRGRLSCAHVPQHTYAHVLQPLTMLGRTEEADDYQRRGYRMINRNKDFLGDVAEHMAYLLYRGREDKATHYFERHLAWALATREYLNQYEFYIASLELLRRLAEKRKSKRLNLPAAFELREESGTYTLASLVTWFEKACADLAARFDACHGNDHFSTAYPRRLLY